MQIELNKKQANLKIEIREYLQDLLTHELLKELQDPSYFEGGGPEFRKALLRMGNDGWIGLSWPKSLGGKEFSPIEQYIFAEEIMRTGFPFPFLTTESVGPMIANYGGQWWLNTNDQEISPELYKVNYSIYSANGFQGQRLLVIPDLDLLIVRMGLTDGRTEWNNEGAFIKDLINIYAN